MAFIANPGALVTALILIFSNSRVATPSVVMLYNQVSKSLFITSTQAAAVNNSPRVVRCLAILADSIRDAKSYLVSVLFRRYGSHKICRNNSSSTTTLFGSIFY